MNVTNIVDHQKVFWLLQDGEVLPTDPNPQKMRTARLAQALVEKGHLVYWFASRFDHGKKVQRTTNSVDITWNQNCKIILLDGPGYTKNLSVARILHQREVARNFAKTADKYPKPALVLASYPSPELCYAGKRYCQRYNIKFVPDVRDPWPDAVMLDRSKFFNFAALPVINYYRLLLKKSLINGNVIISMSNQMLDWALKYAGRIKSNFDKVFFLGYDSQSCLSSKAIPEMFTPDQPLRCVYYGMFGKVHNGDVIIQVAREFFESKEHRVHFTFIGDGELKERWMEFSKNLDNISFTGWLSDDQAKQILSTAHVGLICISGGVNKYWFGNKFFEYLGNGLPVISDVGGELKQFISQNSLGTNISPGSNRELSAAILNFIESPSLLREHCKKAKEVFNAHFLSSKIYNAYADYLCKLTT